MRKRKDENKRSQIGLIINGPNILLRRFDISLEEILHVLKDIGRIVIGKVVLNHEVSSKLVETVINNGLEPVIVNGRVDVAVAIESMKVIYNPLIDILALGVRDAHFMPLLFEAKRVGKEVIVVAPADKVSNALQNTADRIIGLPLFKPMSKVSMILDRKPKLYNLFP